MEVDTLRSLSQRIFQIRPGFQDYSWGMTDSDCFVARMTERVAQRYAEVWYGDHVNGSAVCLDHLAYDIPLCELIPRAPELFLGSTAEWYQGKLLLMAKILSVREPLSIQVHPKEEDAKRLHGIRPDQYPDPYPKDEAGIALSKVELLHGFLSFAQIAQHVNDVPEFAKLIGENFAKAKALAENDEAAAVKTIFAAVWNSDQADIQAACSKLYSRLESIRAIGLSEAECWVLKMGEYYPQGEPGIFGFFLMNLIRLTAGRGIEIPTGCPHAYLSGELLEVMKPSDMVIRCGLTPKFRDDAELLNCSDFTPSSPILLEGETTSGVMSYFFESGLTVDVLDKGGDFTTASKPEILLSLDASGEIRFGDAKLDMVSTESFLVPAGVSGYTLGISSGRLIRFRRC